MKVTAQTEDRIQSIMHMVVNFGEQSNYPEQLLKEFNRLLIDSCEERDILIKVLETKLAAEAYEHSEDYLAFACEEDENKTNLELLQELIVEWHAILNNYIN
jgi:hypothetical protein